MSDSSSGARWIAALVLVGAVLVGACEWLLSPPRAWLARTVLQMSDQHLTLESFEGGIFEGAAQLRWQGGLGPAQALGDWAWQFGWLTGSASGLGWTLRTRGGPLHGSVQVQPGLNTWTLHALTLSLPAPAVPAGLMAWDLLHAGGEIDLSAEHLALSAGKMMGSGVLRWQQASTVMTPLAPLGSWSAAWDARGELGTFRLTTLRGPLHVEGSGRFGLDGRIGVQARLWAEPASTGELTPLLSAVGTVREDGSVTFERPWPPH